MGETIQLKAADGFELDAYVARPTGPVRGAVVVVQEIFGVNAHIRSVADWFAAEGYLAIAPALFDRIEKHFEVGYDDASRGKAMSFIGKVDRESAKLDIAAAIAPVAEAGKVGIVGYCWGGTMAWVSAGQLPGLSAAVGYYGHGVLAMPDLQPACPVMLHFGARDAHIPVAQVEAFAAAREDVPTYIYDADHGFNCDARSSYDKASADLAQQRTLAFFAAHLQD